MGGLTSLLLLLCVGVTVSSVLDLQKRIIGGDKCPSDKRGYHVRLIVDEGTTSSLCGGSLISDSWILTAAHCWEYGWTIWAEVGVHPNGGQHVKIKAEPETFMDSNNRDHDLMLLKLPSPSSVQPVALPDCKDHPKKVKIAGHGANTGGPKDERNDLSLTLQCAEVDVVSCKDLENRLQKHFPLAYQVKEYQHWFCGQSPGKDISKGDSGGGAVYQDKIYGVFSFLGDPVSLYTHAAAFMDLCNPEYDKWVRETIDK